jgi:hypothetical protein
VADAFLVVSWLSYIWDASTTVMTLQSDWYAYRCAGRCTDCSLFVFVVRHTCGRSKGTTLLTCGSSCCATYWPTLAAAAPCFSAVLQLQQYLRSSCWHSLQQHWQRSWQQAQLASSMPNAKHGRSMCDQPVAFDSCQVGQCSRPIASDRDSTSSVLLSKPGVQGAALGTVGEGRLLFKDCWLDGSSNCWVLSVRAAYGWAQDGFASAHCFMAVFKYCDVVADMVCRRMYPRASVLLVLLLREMSSRLSIVNASWCVQQHLPQRHLLLGMLPRNAS